MTVDAETKAEAEITADAEMKAEAGMTAEAEMKTEAEITADAEMRAEAEMAAVAEMKEEAAVRPTQTAAIPENPVEEIQTDGMAEEDRKWIAADVTMTVVRRTRMSGEVMTVDASERRGKVVTFPE